MSEFSRTLSLIIPYAFGGAAFLIFVSATMLAAPSARLLSSTAIAILCALLLVHAAVRHITLFSLFPLRTAVIALVLFGCFSFSALLDVSHYSAVMGFAGEIGSLFSFVVCLLAAAAGYCMSRMGHSLRPVFLGILSASVLSIVVAIGERVVSDAPYILLDPLLTAFGMVSALAFGGIILRPNIFLNVSSWGISAVVATLMAGVFTVYVSTSSFSIESIRPSAATTAHVVAHVYTAESKNTLSTMLFGLGPNGFERAWNMYRPLLVNRSDLWDTDFMNGNGLMLTLMVTSGTFALLILYLCIGGLTCVCLRRAQTDCREMASYMWSSLVCTWTFLFISWVIMPPLGALLLVFIMVGACAGWMQSEALDHQKKGLYVFLSYLPVVLFLLICVLVTVSRYGAVSLYSEAVAVADERNTTTDARALLEQSVRWSDTPEAHLALARLYLHEIRILIERGGEDPEVVRKEIATLFAHARASAQRPTVVHNRNDLRYLIEAGNVLFIGAQLGLVDDGDSIESFYRAARAAAPMHPLPHFLLARLAIEKLDYAKARSSLSKALELRSNYKEALELLQRLPESPSLQ